MAQRPGSRSYELPPSAPFTNHGKTKASWALIWIVSLGFLLVGLGMIFSQLWLVITGIVVTIAGLVVSKVMRDMGLGQPSRREGQETKKADWYS